MAMGLVQILNRRRFWQGRWLVVLAMVSCWLVIWTTPGVATGDQVLSSGVEQVEIGEPADGETVATGSPMTQGSALFAAGRLAAAADVWQQAAQQYETQGNHLEQARALYYLALADFNLGRWELAHQANGQSQTLLKTAATDTALLGANLNLQGQLQLVLGQPEQAIETWQQAAAIYVSVGDATGQLGAQLNRARALQTLGHYQQSQQLLEQSLAKIQTQADPAVKATGLKLLGIALQAVGDLERSQSLLTESLALTQPLVATKPIFANQASATLLSLGNTLAASGETAAALTHYQQAANLAIQPLARLEAQLNQLQLLVKTEQWSQAQPLISALPHQLQALPPGRDTVYAQVNFAASWMRFAQGRDQSAQTRIAQLLADAVQMARGIGDIRAEAFALGQLGHLYETVQQWQDAQQVTQEAMQLAQGLDAPDLKMAWQWQLGRILKQQGQTDGAIAAYSEAVGSLQSLRQELVALNPDLQFSFLETVEPVYRELVALLLDNQPQQPQLQQARQLIESLQLAELDNFFRHACLEAKSQLIDTVDPTAAIVYPIILADRLAVIVSRPGLPLIHYETRLPQPEIEAAIAQLQLYLNPHFFEADRLRVSQQLYDWLIRPATDFLAETQTLVFVLDGTLRNLPMAVLHDGQHYLVERYGIALSPGLQLLEPQSLSVGQLDVLTGGLSVPQQGFAALPAVDIEVNQIAATLPTTQLLNQTFTTDRLKRTLNDVPFSVVHLATHGQFSSRVEDTFLVTWDGRINVQDLDALLQPRRRDPQQPLELLVLSACQTATGDKRAALGLAGMALRSGARSTLATLWQVKDESTATLMAQFYQQLAENPGMTKAAALRAAQLSLLQQPQYQHPFYWAPFVLVGNWL
ncbi:tetratricopeptide repeat domain protein [Leptolyngbya sp. Heron Island J]|uniref:CHAT domain-containing protein n=1 Tax=Leptolyngbya sp. Heron Island J TaxID=1385935 RepID=UPI0003B9F21A|nr:CHAT domain-containing protein [Leptolyngbya sp. Heron Island J]ESA37869.1 tetratricopeptide repeat domain protein [Leptolyngbya sp. Heron Island J]